MIAAIVNAVAIALGGLIGTLFGNKIQEKYTNGIMICIAMILLVIGVQGAIATESILTIVICCVLGTLIGTALRLDDRINDLGDVVKRKLESTPFVKGRFGDALVTTTLLFGVGSMAIIGSIRAGLDRDYSIIFTKSLLDFVSAIAFASAMGPGVIFSSVTILVYQGAITLLAGAVEPYLTADIVREMTAAGGPIFIGMSINMLGLREERIRIGDMMPAIVVPIVYLPLTAMLSSLF